MRPEIVHDCHLMTGGQVKIDDMGSDEAGAAGYQDAHATPSSFCIYSLLATRSGRCRPGVLGTPAPPLPVLRQEAKELRAFAETARTLVPVAGHLPDDAQH